MSKFLFTNIFHIIFLSIKIIYAEEFCGLPAIPFSGFVEPDLNFYELNTNVTYKCNTSYVLRGVEKNFCIGHGIWKYKPPECRLNFLFKKKMAVLTGFNRETKSESLNNLVDHNLTTCDTLMDIGDENHILTISAIKNELIVHQRLTITTEFILQDPKVQLFTILLYENGIESGIKNITCNQAFEFYEDQNDPKRLRWTANCGYKNITNESEIKIQLSIHNETEICEVQLFLGEYVECGKPDIPPYCDLVENGSSNKYKTVKYKPKDGCVLKGKNYRKCDNGYWFGNGPICERKATETSNKNENSEFNRYTASALVLSWFIFVGIALYLKTHSVKKRIRKKYEMERITMTELLATEQIDVEQRESVFYEEIEHFDSQSMTCGASTCDDNDEDWNVNSVYERSRGLSSDAFMSTA